MLLNIFLNPVWVIFFSLFCFIFCYGVYNRTSFLFRVSPTNALRTLLGEEKNKQFYGRGNWEKIIPLSFIGDFRKLHSVDESFSFANQTQFHGIYEISFPDDAVKLSSLDRVFFNRFWERMLTSTERRSSHRLISYQWLYNQMNRHVSKVN